MYIISALGLWAHMRREIRGAADNVRRWLLTAPDTLAPMPYRWFIELLLEVDDTNHSRVTWRPYGLEFFNHSQDPVTDLASVPVASRHLAEVPEDARNLLAILSLMTATPGDLLTVNGYGHSDVYEARAELAFFAAAYLNLGTKRPSSGLDDATLAVFLRRLVSRTELWLSADFPRRVFAPKVESIIGSCSSLGA